jgi:hypothetical protein
VRTISPWAFGAAIVAACSTFGTEDVPVPLPEDSPDGGGGDGGGTIPEQDSGVGASCVDDEDCTPLQRCDEVLACEGGECVQRVAPCVDEDPFDCVTRSCADGRCLQYEVPDGEACDDGDACTEDDRCGARVCAGTPKAITCSGANNACNPATGDCFCPPDKPVRCGSECFASCCPGAIVPRAGTCPDNCGVARCSSDGSGRTCTPAAGSNCGPGIGTCDSSGCPAMTSRRCQPHVEGNVDANRCSCSGCY